SDCRDCVQNPAEILSAAGYLSPMTPGSCQLSAYGQIPADSNGLRPICLEKISWLTQRSGEIRGEIAGAGLDELAEGLLHRGWGSLRLPQFHHRRFLFASADPCVWFCLIHAPLR